jgi:hypothetical protein
MEQKNQFRVQLKRKQLKNQPKTDNHVGTSTGTSTDSTNTINGTNTNNTNNTTTAINVFASAARVQLEARQVFKGSQAAQASRIFKSVAQAKPC